jgi:hypothetical protein
MAALQGTSVRTAAMGLAVTICAASFAGARQAEEINAETVGCRVQEAHASGAPR